MPSVSVAPPPFISPEKLIKSSHSLPVNGNAASSVAEPVADATGSNRLLLTVVLGLLSWDLVLKLSRSPILMYLMYEMLGVTIVSCTCY